MAKILKKILISMFVLLFILLLYVILFKTNQEYIFKRENINISKVLVIAIDFIFVFLFVSLVKVKDISSKKYYVLISFMQIIFFVFQIIILLNIKYNTGWDVKYIKDAVDTYIKNGNIINNDYLTMYPNNLLLVGILAILAKLPFIGKYYITTLIFNTAIVNISVLFSSLSMKNYHSNKAGILIYLFTIPLILLNPWFVIPYSDTFSFLFISIICYIYSKTEKKQKDLYLIVFLSIFGSFIKPTVIIPIISIIICELLYKKNKQYKNYKNYIIVFFSIISALLLKDCIINNLNFRPVSGKHSMTMFHYLAMGQNNNTFGTYNYMDEMNSYNHGIKYDINQFKSRFKKNIGSNHINLLINKTAIAFGDGSFGWGSYGTFFSNKESKKIKNNVFQELYYENGKYYDCFLYISNLIFYCLLLFLPFILLKKINKNELFLITTFIGLFVFILIFEPHSRYIYSFSSIIISISLLGLYKIYDLLK